MVEKLKFSIRELLSGSYYRLVAVSVGLAVLPLICALIAAEIGAYRQKAQFFMNMSAEVGSAVQAQQAGVAKSAVTVLNGLADNYDAYGYEVERCRELFSLTLRMYPNIRSVTLYERDGTPAVTSGSDGMPARRLEQIAANILLSGIVSGETIITNAHGAQELIFIKPLRNNDGTIERFLTLSVGLDSYVRMIRSLNLPFAYSIAMFNQERMLILSADDPGQQNPLAFETDSPLTKSWAHGEYGTEIIIGKNGQQYVCTFFSQKINAFSRPYLITLLTSPREELLLGAYQAATTSLLWVIIAVLGTVLVLTAACSAAFKRPINRLLATSRKLGLGEFSARSELAEVGGAFRGYALALAGMAASLEKDEQTLKSARLDAELANRTKSEFLANMSHELRTPMNAILGMTYLALKNDISPAQLSYVQKIQEASRNLLRIISDILDFSRLEADKMYLEKVRFSIRDLFRALPGSYHRQLEERGIKMEIEVDEAVPLYLMGDHRHIEQVMKLLTDNAIQRTKGGALRIGCSLIGSAGNDCALRITVADTGKSLEPDVLLGTVLAADGSGSQTDAENSPEQELWPSVACKLIAMMNGSISVTSEPGRGTVFTCTAHFEHNTFDQRRDTSALVGKRILLLDNDEASINLHLSLLRGFSMRANGFCQAPPTLGELAGADAEDAGYDFLVLDWHSSEPDMGGLLQYIRNSMNLKKNPAILVISAFGRDEVRALAETAGADAFLHKPIHASLLIDTLLDLCGGKARPAANPYRPDTIQSKDEFADFRILLVEDNPVNQQLAQTILEKAGSRVSVASNGSAALNILAAGRGEQSFDIIAMDLEMPGMDGFEATWRIRKDGHLGAMHMPVIAMTTHHNADVAEACRKSGMDDYLTKPIEPDLFFNALRRWAPITPDTLRVLADPLETLSTLLRAGDQEEASSCFTKIRTHLRQFVGDGRVEKLQQLILDAELSKARNFAMYLHEKLLEGKD